MIGERLAEIRKDFGEKQGELAAYLCVSLSTVRSWERDKSAPSHEALVAICKRYRVSADYLLGLSNADPSSFRSEATSRFSRDELKELQGYGSYLLWKRGRKK